MPLFRRPGSPAGAEGDPAVRAEVLDTPTGTDGDLPPSRMRGTEFLYGYVVALELLVVAILNIVISKGKGAPAHPQTGLQIIGLLAPLVLVGLIQSRNRTMVGFASIVAAFFVTLPKVPTSLTVAHVLALAVPLAYGLIVTQRQRRAMGNTARRGGRGATQSTGSRATSGAGGSAGGSGGANGRRRGRKGAKEAVPSGPRPNSRYTPPKAKRGNSTR